MFSLWRHRFQARAAARKLLRQNIESETPAQIDDAMQRLGQPAVARPEGELLWVHHAAGADPAATTLLLSRLRDDRGAFSVLVTSATPPAPITAPDMIQQALPTDTSGSVRRFLDHWSPDACLWAGTDWPPLLLSQTAARKIPAVCTDARLIDTPSHRRKSALTRAGLSGFQKIITGSQRDAARLISLGARADQVECLGWLEASTGALCCNESEWTHLNEAFEARPLWLAVDIPETEFSAIAEAHRRASRLAHRLLLILVPADPDAGPALRARLEAEGWRTALRSADEEPGEETQIYLADTTGELGLWYRLAAITFMGQTLFGTAPGRAPSEAAALGSVVVHGPQTDGHGAAYARLRRAAAQCEVATPTALGRMVERLLAPDQAAELASAAWAEVTTGAEASDRALTLLNAALNGEPI